MENISDPYDLFDSEFHSESEIQTHYQNYLSNISKLYIYSFVNMKSDIYLNNLLKAITRLIIDCYKLKPEKLIFDLKTNRDRLIIDIKEMYQTDFWAEDDIIVKFPYLADAEKIKIDIDNRIIERDILNIPPDKYINKELSDKMIEKLEKAFEAYFKTLSK